MIMIEQHIDQITSICQKRKVKSLWVFGSVLNPSLFNENSDVDVVIEFEKIDERDYADNYFTLKEELEKTFQHEVDIVSEQFLRNPIFIHQLNTTKRLVFSK
jgi:uncharacterized protein